MFIPSPTTGGRQPVNSRPQPVKLESTCKFKAQTGIY